MAADTEGFTSMDVIEVKWLIVWYLTRYDRQYVIPCALGGPFCCKFPCTWQAQECCQCRIGVLCWFVPVKIVHGQIGAIRTIAKPDCDIATRELVRSVTVRW